MKERIGFIGQGWIGRNYANDFEARGFEVVRYSLEPEYSENKSKIADCSITFIAVPTPTTPQGFDDSYIKSALTNISEGNIAVIKSTTMPGLVASLQEQFPRILVLHSPEFLVEKTAAHDAAHPNRNIIGVPKDTPAYIEAAERVLAVLPNAPYNTVMSSLDSELVKYAGNCFLYTKVLFMNTLFDVVEKSGGDWEKVRAALVHDLRIGESHTNPVNDGGRGAGGHCFIKDYEAFRQYYKQTVGEDAAYQILSASAAYNMKLLSESGKDTELLRGVYGDAIL
jgi:UDPglucose 6-dehydrogenase